MFYVSHSAGSVRRMCDRVIVLEEGGALFYALPADPPEIAALYRSLL